MKLRNKKTGEIKEVQPITIGGFRSLAELNAEWEDVAEEPKGNWYINEFGIPTKADFVGRETLYDKCRKNFGNFFETKEEAELAVRRLEALKRLKDEGMIIYSFRKEKTGIDLDFYTLTILAPRDKDSLDLLFGGEE